MKYNTGALPETTPYWSPRVGFNWDVSGNQAHAGSRRHGPLLGQAAVRLDLEPDRQHRRAVRVHRHATNVTTYPFNPSPDKYKPAADGRRGGQLRARRDGQGLPLPADVAHQHRRRPHACRGASSARSTTSTTATSTRRSTSTPTCRRPTAPTPAWTTGRAGSRRRRRSAAPGITVAPPACVTTVGLENGPCLTRINNAAATQVTDDLRDQEPGPEPLAEHLGRGHEEHDAAASRSRAASTTACRAASSNRHRQPAARGAGAIRSSTDPNNPALAYSAELARQARLRGGELQRSSYFSWGATTFSAFYDGHTNGNTSYLFASDAQRRRLNANDLIYIPKDTSEMNFKPLTRERQDVHRRRPGRRVRDS